jgi:hypothetical protein
MTSRCVVAVIDVVTVGRLVDVAIFFGVGFDFIEGMLTQPVDLVELHNTGKCTGRVFVLNDVSGQTSIGCNVIIQHLTIGLVQ